MTEKILQQKIYGSNEAYTQYENGLGDIAKKGIDAEGLLFEEHNTGDRFVWDDLRFPLVGRSIDVSSGRLDYDFFNGGVKFEDNARYPNEPISFMVQVPHAWVESSELRPHIHWLQQSSAVPNFLLAYKKYKKGDLTTIDTDYSNHTLLPINGGVFTYTSGVIHQLSTFASIDMTGFKLSDCIHMVLFRDYDNTSGEFAGAEVSPLDERVLEFDIHYQINSNGSRQEFIK